MDTVIMHWDRPFISEKTIVEHRCIVLGDSSLFLEGGSKILMQVFCKYKIASSFYNYAIHACKLFNYS